jgi:hypothetical protein|tara:strand:- start:1093 stop:1374 length:282 start_codon:yes stop_codon:yes gene_type:complete
MKIINNDNGKSGAKGKFSLKRLLVYFVCAFILLTLSYKTGVRGYQMRKPLDWECLFYSLPKIAIFAVIASIVLYSYQWYVQKNKANTKQIKEK